MKSNTARKMTPFAKPEGTPAEQKLAWRWGVGYVVVPHAQPTTLRILSRGDFTEKEIRAMEKHYGCPIKRPVLAPKKK